MSLPWQAALCSVSLSNTEPLGVLQAQTGAPVRRESRARISQEAATSAASIVGARHGHGRRLRQSSIQPAWPSSSVKVLPPTENVVAQHRRRR